MELLSLLKHAAELGLTVPAVVGVAIIYQINQKFNHFDVRVSVLEAQSRRSSDK